MYSYNNKNKYIKNTCYIKNAWLLDMGNENFRDICTTIPTLFFSNRPTLPPLEFDDPSTNTVHSWVFPSSGTAISAMKSVDAWALSAFLDSKVISNSDSSIDHLVILLNRSGRNKIYFMGKFVCILIRWTRKYCLSLPAAIINTSATF